MKSWCRAEHETRPTEVAFVAPAGNRPLTPALSRREREPVTNEVVTVQGIVDFFWKYTPGVSPFR